MDIQDLKTKKKKGKIVVLTCYDYAMAKLIDKVGIDMILVGDSLGMVVLGYETTRQVTMEDMIRHTSAVRRGSERVLLIGDMPYGSYDSPKQAVANARLLVEAGADMVKVERARPIKDIIEALVGEGIEVMGHLGLTPQTAESFKVEGRLPEQAQNIREDALLLQDLGVNSLILESIPRDLAGEVTASLDIPTIGIGAGPDTDGQVLVLYDLLGLFADFEPKFVKKYADLASIISDAVLKYKEDVLNIRYPGEEHSYT